MSRSWQQERDTALCEIVPVIIITGNSESPRGHTVCSRSVVIENESRKRRKRHKRGCLSPWLSPQPWCRSVNRSDITSHSSCVFLADSYGIDRQTDAEMEGFICPSCKPYACVCVFLWPLSLCLSLFAVCLIACECIAFFEMVCLCLFRSGWAWN